MDFKWYGQSCFQITGKKNLNSRQRISILTDPFSEEAGIKLYKKNVDIVLISHDHQDHNNLEAVNEEAFVINSPGEYEVKNIFIKGVFSYHDDQKGEERGANTIYVMEVEGMNVCHLGDLGQKELLIDQIKEIGEVDVLLVPIGGNYTINAKTASTIVSQLEPKAVIPMHYKIPGLKYELEEPDAFFKAMGAKEKQAEEKASISKSELSEGEIRVFRLDPQT